MKPTIKKLFAREFLIFIVPLLLFLIVLFGSASIIRIKLNKKGERIKQIQAERTWTAPETDSIVDGSGETLPLPPRKSAQRDSTFGFVPDTEVDRLEDEMSELYELRENLYDNNGYEGLLGKIYLLILILLYPIRLLIYSIIWSIKVLREN